jgi:hypothetical protein
MQFINTVLIACLVVVMDGAKVEVGHAQDGSDFSITCNNFAKLNVEEKNHLVHSAFQFRRVHTQNLYYDSTLVVRNHNFSDGTVHDIVWSGLKFGYEHWQLEDSCVVAESRYGDPSNATPKKVVLSRFNSKVGESATGKVSRWHHPNLMNRYSYWLYGEDSGVAESHLVRLVEYREDYVFEIPENGELIKLVVPWRPHGFPKAHGSWEYFVDPSKGFLPVRGSGSWKDESKESRHWRVEEFIASDFELVSGVWMPKSLREIVRASTAEAGVAN